MVSLLRTVLCAVCAAFLCVPAMAQGAPERTAIVSAFAPEWVALKAGVEDAQSQTINGVEFVTGTLAGEPVVLFLSGIGMVNSAMTTQLALERFSVSRIVVSGVAGGVDPERNIGDVVVAERWGSYLYMVLARETEDGFAVPPFFGRPFANFGMMFPQNSVIRSAGEAEPVARFWFEADADLLELARQVAANVDLSGCPGDGGCLATTPDVVVGGNGVSGSAFVDNADFRAYVFETFDAQLLDMETAAIAQVAHANGVPYVAFRSLSDLAGGGEGENEIAVFLSLAADNSAALVRAFLAALAAQ